jgi:ABC-type nitrate/sulfonate/bicarbonate transport system substrate-binding protein
VFRRAILVVMTVAAGLAMLPAAPAFADSPKIVLAPPGVPPIFIGIITFVAQEQGFFKKYGADVELRQFDNGTAAARAVVSGDLDASMSSTALVISQIANADVTLVGIDGFPKPDFQLATSDASKAACADVKGQQVGVDTPGGARSIALKAILASCQMSIDDVQQVALGSNTSSAMIAGQLRYGILHLDDVPDIESHGKKITVIKTLLAATPDSHNLMIVARKDRLAEKRDGFVRMVAGLIAASRFMADPKNAERVATIAEVTGRSHAIALGALQGYLHYGLWSTNDDGMNQQQLENFIALQAKAGSIKDGKTPPTYAQLVDPSIWRDANAMVGK